jgi:SAM-dependent methyltransferase
MTPFLWTQSRIVREYLHERVSGDPRCDWVTWMLYRHASERADGGRRLSALVLGCGDGWLERRLATDDRIGHVTGIDISEGAIEGARKSAEAAGLADRIEHAVVDLDREGLPTGPWDLVLSHDVIHHVRDLEGLYRRIANALAPSGWLLFCEYVGPNRFDYDRRRQGLADEALLSLPEKYRRLPGGRGLATRGIRSDPGEVARLDPSEAVRSDAILPVLRASRDLEIVEEIPYGGSLLSPLLFELVVNFEEGNPEDEAVMRGLCAREKSLIASGELPSDYFVVAARLRADVVVAARRR